ncbi:MAG: HAD family phosphatase [Thermoleophilaceae bacterium]|nr:HAD family phosphatase [Thermoleophilaceae bacterium]
MFELVIFDCDGVLVDSEPISNRVLAETLTDCGLATTAEQALEFYKGRILRDVTARAEERNGGPLPDGWIEQFESARAVAFENELEAIEGARELVEAVKAAGIDVCVATQGKPFKVAQTLHITGLRELFDDDAIFTAYEVPRGKPFPDLFLHAASTRGVAPANTAVIEDTDIGVTAAVAAGMTAFGYADETPASAIVVAGGKPFELMSQVPALLGADAGSAWTL